MEKPQRHPLEYDEEPLPLLLRPLSWVLYAICAALVPVKIVLLAVVGCVGVVLSDLLPRRRAGAPLQLVIRCGISGVDVAGARANLAAEGRTWDFDAVRRAAQGRWTRELGAIGVEGGTEDQRTIFTSALYPALLRWSKYRA